MNIREFLQLDKFYKEGFCTICSQEEHTTNCPVSILEGSKFVYTGYEDRYDSHKFREEGTNLGDMVPNINKAMSNYGDLYIESGEIYDSGLAALVIENIDRLKKEEEIATKVRRVSEMQKSLKNLEDTKSDLSEQGYTKRLNALKEYYKDIWI